MNELISVIIPIYNVERYLKRCLNTVIKQTYKNIEIILIDDGSTDKCGQICDKYAKKDNRIIVIHKKNGGLSAARNCGIRKAKGEYYVFIDSDDFVERNMVERMYKTIKNDNSDLCICNRLEFYEEKKKNMYKKTYINSYKHQIFSKIDALKELCSFKYFDMSAWAKMYKKELFSNIEFPVGKLSEDYYIMYKIFDKCSIVSYINEYLYIYVQRKGSISKNKKINFDYMYAAERQMEYLEKKYPELKNYGRTAYALSNITIFNWYIKNRNSFPEEKIYEKLKKTVFDNKKIIYSNKSIPFSRKIQVFLFLFSKYAYFLFYKIYSL